ncbi:MAG: response regulator transcription factor [Ignavibacteria bacterium]|nr:response regulator transcription factor [Ignavibacteria bacterium]MBT8382882.1 response regulator transcription factor [Ignavibacteria bacterium]MBT8390454.1 response regulator transcription factor [Ignavibacteria bacterium]NNJ52930.1 response regulator transcription factor [Ignavibacteriaceae bacterium]NNL21365.1 response regulator transcription factor [Ignavibacteriaceae bacterium]
MHIKVAIIEDNVTLRSSLQDIFDDSGYMKVVSSLESCYQIVPEYKQTLPDVALVDIGLKNNESGIDCVHIIRQYFPEIRIMMFTVFEDDDKIFDSICAGASGYLLKKTPPEEIIRSLIALFEGGAPMTPSIANRTLELFRDKIHPPQTEWGLTSREKEILKLLAEGYTYQNIASKLFISISTVRTHIMHIYEKLQVNSKIEAIRKLKL